MTTQSQEQLIEEAIKEYDERYAEYLDKLYESFPEKSHLPIFRKLFKGFLETKLKTIASKSAESGKEQGLKDSLVLAYDLADKNGSLDYGKLHRRVEEALSKGTK